MRTTGWAVTGLVAVAVASSMLSAYGSVTRPASSEWGRLLGYERDQVREPWIIDTLARAILRRRATTVPWGAVRWR